MTPSFLGNAYSDVYTAYSAYSLGNANALKIA